MRKGLGLALLAAALCLGTGGRRARWARVPDEVPTLPPLPLEEPFADVAFGQRWYDGAQYGYRNGLVRGITGREFGGEEPATRAMAAAMVWRLAGEPRGPGESPFGDVEPGSYYAPAVAWGEEMGLWRGYGDGTFRPHQGITRGQLKLVLGRCCGEGRPAGAAVGPPLFAEGGSWGEPGGEVTRGELAELLMELREKGRSGGFRGGNG